MQAVLDVHDTAFKTGSFPLVGLGVLWMVQLAPSHNSVNVT